MSLFSNKPRNARAGKVVKVVTPAMFFGAEGFAPVFNSRKEFLDYGEGLRPTEERDLGVFLSNAKRRVKSDGDTEIHEDQGGREYLYPHFKRGNTSPGTKIVLGGDLLRFVTEFFDDQFVIGFDLQELIDEARR